MENKSYLEDYNCKKGDEVTIHLIESRDDTVFCFQAEQKADVILEDIRFMDSSKLSPEYTEKFYYPILKTKSKNKRNNVHMNQFLSWKLYKNDELILQHKHKDTIIKGTYKKGELKKQRERCLKLQRIK
jgi:hypothetical protein